MMCQGADSADIFPIAGARDPEVSAAVTCSQPADHKGVCPLPIAVALDSVWPYGRLGFFLARLMLGYELLLNVGGNRLVMAELH